MVPAIVHRLADLSTEGGPVQSRGEAVALPVTLNFVAQADRMERDHVYMSPPDGFHNSLAVFQQPGSAAPRDGESSFGSVEAIAADANIAEKRDERSRLPWMLHKDWQYSVHETGK